MSYEIVSYNPRLREQIVTLQRGLWSPDVAANSAYFAWKYEDNPYISKPLLYVALHHGRVVGVRGLFGTKWQVGSPPFEIVLPANADTVLLSDHRGAGLYQKLTRFLIEDLSAQGYPYVLNLSASPVNLLNSMMLGWRKIGSFDALERRSWRNRVINQRCRRTVQWVRSYPLLDAAAQWGRKALAQRPARRRAKGGPIADRSFYRLDAHDPNESHNHGLPIAITGMPRPAAMADVVQRTGVAQPITHVRDEGYFAWRFRNPFAQYRFLYCGEGTLQGFLVVCRMTIQPPGVVAIVDWQGTSDDAMAELLGTLVKAGGFEKLLIWTASLPAAAKESLWAAGFQPLEEATERSVQSPVPIIRKLGGEKDPATWRVGDRSALNIANWDLRAIYSDSY